MPGVTGVTDVQTDGYANTCAQAKAEAAGLRGTERPGAPMAGSVRGVPQEGSLAVLVRGVGDLLLPMPPPGRADVKDACVKSAESAESAG